MKMDSYSVVFEPDSTAYPALVIGEYSNSAFIGLGFALAGGYDVTVCRRIYSEPNCWRAESEGGFVRLFTTLEEALYVWSFLTGEFGWRPEIYPAAPRQRDRHQTAEFRLYSAPLQLYMPMVTADSSGRLLVYLPGNAEMPETVRFAGRVAAADQFSDSGRRLGSGNKAFRVFEEVL